MASALIVSGSGKGLAFLTEMLNVAAFDAIVAVGLCGEARRLVSQRDFDLVMINAPLPDETGEALARDIAGSGAAQAMLIVRNEHFDAISAACEADGVLTVAKPVNRAVFWAALKLALSAQSRAKRMRAENNRLKQKIDDIRTIDRAKCLLISHLRMSEQEAHRYIEKQAMDRRVTKKAIAEGILKTYEN